MRDSRETARAFVVGYPVKHSRSPLIHSYWLQQFGLTGSYEKIEVEPAHFADFIERLKRGESGYRGGNVTIPHKEAAMQLVDQSDDLSREIGAVNTLWLEEGRLCASNTDGIGFLENLDANCPGWTHARKAVVLGAGGASRAIVQALRDRGFLEVNIVNRTIARAQELAHRFGPKVHAHPMGALAELMPEAGLFVNTTSLGMDGSPVPTLPFARMPRNGVVTDIVYVPLMTPVMLQAHQAGLRTVDGLGMLLHQAVPGFAKWFGKRPEVTPELRALVISDMEQHG